MEVPISFSLPLRREADMLSSARWKTSAWSATSSAFFRSSFMLYTSHDHVGDQDMGPAQSRLDVHLSLAAAAPLGELQVVAGGRYALQGGEQVAHYVDVPYHGPQLSALHDEAVLGPEGEVLAAGLAALAVHQVEAVAQLG